MLIAGTANPHIQAYLRGSGRNVESMEVIAVSDFDPSRLEKARTMLGPSAQVTFHPDFNEMFDRYQDADAVMIGSDNIDHFEMFQAAVKHRFHIYMMKVASMNEDECREMIAMERAYDHIVQCELELHFNPQFALARQMVQQGALGEIQAIYLTNISQSPCDWYPNWGDPRLSYGSVVPIRPGSKVFRGGAITDHPHPYDLIRWITGREFATVNAISAKNQRSYLQVEDHAAITGMLDNGIRYFVNPSYSNLEERVAARRLLWPKSLECNLKITGSKGYLAADYFDRHVYWLGNRAPSPDRLLVDGTPRTLNQSRYSLIGSFVETIRGNRPRPETTLEDDFAAIRVMNAAYESIYHNQTITLEPKR